jgi:hypothetical protein
VKSIAPLRSQRPPPSQHEEAVLILFHDVVKLAGITIPGQAGMSSRRSGQDDDAIIADRDNGFQRHVAADATRPTSITALVHIERAGKSP